MENPEWFTSPFREVRWEPLFKEQIEALAIDPGRLDRALSYLDFSVSTSPETYPRVPGTPFSRAMLNIYEDAPPLRVFFTYDATTVKLICIEFAY